jgi:hypothetical protein
MLFRYTKLVKNAQSILKLNFHSTMLLLNAIFLKHVQKRQKARSIYFYLHINLLSNLRLNCYKEIWYWWHSFKIITSILLDIFTILNLRDRRKLTSNINILPTLCLNHSTSLHEADCTIKKNVFEISQRTKVFLKMWAIKKNTARLGEAPQG